MRGAAKATADGWLQCPPVKLVQQTRVIQIDPESRFDMLATLFPVESDVWYSNGLESFQCSRRSALGGALLTYTEVS